MKQNRKTEVIAGLSQTDLEQVAKLPFFSHVSAEHLEHLFKDTSVSTYPHTGLLFNHNDPAEHIYILLEGMVTISLYHEDGSQAVIETILPVRTFAEAAAFLRGHYPATAEYSAGSKIITIPMALFLSRLETSPQTAFSILGSLALRERELSAQLDTLKLHTPSQRLIQYFLEHIPEDVNGAHTLSLPLDKGTMAKKLGITPESLSRLLARLSEHGITNTRKAVQITNVAELRSHLDASKKKNRSGG